MLYHLLLPYSDTLPGANVFRYISFRTAWGVITALAVTYWMYPGFIRWMKQQKMNQIIREDGPESHRLGKVGTPTMGGVPLIFGVALSGLLWARLDTPQTWILIASMIGYALIGFVDDWKKVMHQSSDGLAGRWKIVGQLGVGAVAVIYALYAGVIEPVLPIPFLKDTAIHFDALWEGAPDLSILYVGFCLFMLVAISNGVNLTDGLDGLAIGPVMTCAATYGVIAYLAGNRRFAEYLEITYVAGTGELTILAMALVGAGLGFLWYNAYPASIFMGDVGSLSLGGTLGMFAILTKHEILLALVGGIFVLEAASVVIQVVSFKTRGKRVFLMAPIHHHYEKKGWSEPKIIVRFWIISIILALVALSTLKLR